MEIRCLECRKLVTVEASQLGLAVTCPYCDAAIDLPDERDDFESSPERSHWWENSLSTMVSVVFHAGMLFAFALISYGRVGIPQEGEEVAIGTLPNVELDDASTELEAQPEPAAQSAEPEMSMDLQLESPISLATDAASDSALELAPIASAMGGGSGDFDLGSVNIGGSMAGGGSWEGMLNNLRRNGLDIAIAFDSTSSMNGEINEVKSQIERIGKALLKLIPKARISLCTYRDRGDAYLVRGIPLTNNVAEMRSFLYSVRAGGGGDAPEAVEAGLNWAVTNNKFRSKARKVILVFGDAPPHEDRLPQCLNIASDFSRYGGVVSTVTCRRAQAMAQFRRIAKAGEGEAFLTINEREIMTQLVVLVFGAEHRAKVLEAFELLK